MRPFASLISGNISMNTIISFLSEGIGAFWVKELGLSDATPL